MPTTYKVLGQSYPNSTTATTLYTVPSATSAVLSTMTVANLSGSSGTYRISIRPAGAAQTNAMYLAYDVTIGALDTTTITLGLTLAATDVVTVYSSNGNLAFQAFGSEIS